MYCQSTLGSIVKLVNTEVNDWVDGWCWTLTQGPSLSISQGGQLAIASDSPKRLLEFGVVSLGHDLAPYSVHT